jgi:SAM-dependent methyltransferase
MSSAQPDELRNIYANRFKAGLEYRRRVWQVLVEDWFQQWVADSAVVLDLGCGYGEFINAIRCRAKYAMDLNPDSQSRLADGIELIQQDCSTTWPLEAGTLDVVFTSNFFEHLPDKPSLGRTIEQALRCLKPGGRLIAMGPNIKYAKGRYWDFWDHYIPLTEASMAEALTARGFEVERCYAQFLPYSMSGGPQYPLWMLRVYLRLQILWRLAGQQFLVVGRKPTGKST